MEAKVLKDEKQLSMRDLWESRGHWSGEEATVANGTAERTDIAVRRRRQELTDVHVARKRAIR